ASSAASDVYKRQLLYAAKNTEQNHARVLAAWLAALPVTI
ncbi:hypothetical protein NQ351_25295, partial [Klebsiella pneumoniae]|nr:hypothetical protein [Klebsiella pneumoniae]